ncbi:MAG: phospho-N-acetylmuramoyl-pentapeptide-transferase, partial [Gemmatimonas sp.]|uniref:phospho-N-acetylmuramoyl-pentapeptide- transferase n=1 Tax=Gemmatimonas sp. TaxID=1962908 RepID=UPI00391927AE
MLYFLLQPLARDVSVLNLLNYITVRAGAAFVTALLVCFLFGPAIIRRLRDMAVHQVVRAGTPDTHAGKGTTPTMGGFIILVATFLPVLLWARLDNRYVVLAVAVTAWMGGIGFLDDYLKLKQKREGKKNEGLVERYKLAGQVICGLGLGAYLLLDPISTLPGASTTLPFFKYVLIVPAVSWAAWLYIPWVTFILTGVSNAVNLTDGLDGLSSGLVAIAVLTLGLFAYVLGRVDTSGYLQVFYLSGAGELTVFCAAVVGACIGF